MRTFFLTTLYLIGAMPAIAQPAIEWQKTCGGSSFDDPHSIVSTMDNGYIVTGSTASNDGDVFGNHGSFDVWVLKLNNAGAIQWKKVLGGSENEDAWCTLQTPDGGFVIAGSADSDNFDVSNNHGDTDGWIIKLDSVGNVQWTKTLGGSEWDAIQSIVLTPDGGYIAAGLTRSIDGDVTENHGAQDFWVVRLDHAGNIQWQKTYGGSSEDIAHCIKACLDGGYIVAGHTSSFDGDVTDNNGNYDLWIIKINDAGDLEWQKAYGGGGTDVAWDIWQTGDGYAVYGLAGSNDGYVVGHHGLFDYWMLKLDLDGNLVWQKTLGGSQPDWGYKMLPLPDGGFLLTGDTYSTNGDVMDNDGGHDIWIVKLDSTGNIVWQKTLGGAKPEECFGATLTPDGGIALTGYTWSTDGDVLGSPNKGENDFWIVKLSAQTTHTEEPGAGSLTIAPNPSTGLVTISVPDYSGTLQLRVLDMMCRTVLQREIENGATIDIGALPKGPCFFSATTGSTAFNGKVLRE